MRVIIILIAVLLASCQPTQVNEDHDEVVSKHKVKKQASIYNRYKNKFHRYLQAQDGAPDSYHQVSFREPVPSHEPMSHYGNPVEYKVDGRKYQVLTNTKGYKARGIASWYGTKFHKQRTSSGEPYNMYVMTAAHRTLPLPTYVKVRNLDNGKVAIVKVNDRGPFHGDRIIDLSYAAAVKLGVFPKGTARVEVEAIKGPAGQAHYYLQAGAFVTSGSARQLKDKLRHITSAPISIERYNRHYVVKVGPFPSKNMSDALKMKLAKNGVRGAFSVLI